MPLIPIENVFKKRFRPGDIQAALLYFVEKSNRWLKTFSRKIFAKRGKIFTRPVACCDFRSIFSFQSSLANTSESDSLYSTVSLCGMAKIYPINLSCVLLFSSCVILFGTVVKGMDDG